MGEKPTAQRSQGDEFPGTAGQATRYQRGAVESCRGGRLGVDRAHADRVEWHLPPVDMGTRTGVRTGQHGSSRRAIANGEN